MGSQAYLTQKLCHRRQLLFCAKAHLLLIQKRIGQSIFGLFLLKTEIPAVLFVTGVKALDKKNVAQILHYFP
jgi:hypothetical protein